MRRTAAILVAMLMPALAFGSFDPDAIRLKYALGATHHTMGYSGVSVRNVDGRPGEELLVGYRSIWHLLRWNAVRGDFDQVGFYEHSVGDWVGNGGVVNVRFAELDPGQPAQVAVLIEGGAIGLFKLDGTFERSWEPGVPDARRMFFADFDGERGDEVLLQTCQELSAWKFGAASPLWRIPTGGCSQLLVAQLDDDPQLEIVLGTGRIFDSLTREVEWRYPLGFGSVLTSADLNGDGVSDLVGCAGRQCDAFDVRSRTHLWQVFVDYPYEIGSLTAADVDRDGRAEVFAGDQQHGFIRRIDGATGAFGEKIQKMGGTNFVAIGDLDGDCDLELAWAVNGDTTGSDTMHLTDPVTMTNFWDSVPEERGSSGLAVGDFSGTGGTELLWSSRGSSVVHVVGFDPLRRQSLEFSTLFDANNMNLNALTVAQLDDDPQLEYVIPVVGDHFQYNGSVFVYDGATHELEWTLRVAPSDTFSSATASDITGDGIDDLLVGFSIRYFPSDHPQAVIAIDGATRSVLWRTTDIALTDMGMGECASCIVQIEVADLDRDGSLEVLALVPDFGLYCFDAKDGTLLWKRELPVRTWAFAVADIDATAGLEIIIPSYGDQRVAVYDFTAAKLLRETNLGKLGSAVSIATEDFDGDGEREIVLVVDSGLLFLSSRTLDVLWSGGFVFPWLSLGNQIAIADLDGDGTLEIAVPSAHSLRVFEYRPPAIDSSPPLPPAGGVQADALSGCCGISLAWPAATDAESMPVTYRIYRSSGGESSEPSDLIAETPFNTHVDERLTRGGVYRYSARTVDAAGNESVSSTIGSATAPASCPVRRRAVRHQ